MLVGNTFGIKMRGLEANKQKLDRMQNPTPTDKDQPTFVETSIVENKITKENLDSTKSTRQERFETAFTKEKQAFDPNLLIQKKKD